jgi:hypothetical protein
LEDTSLNNKTDSGFDLQDSQILVETVSRTAQSKKLKIVNETKESARQVSPCKSAKGI